jgi:transcriptional regulator with XRE-family HTH domain
MTGRVTPLKIAIVASGLSAREVADRMGRNEADISRWARGHRDPSLEVRLQFAEVLARPAAELFPSHASHGVEPAGSDVSDGRAGQELHHRGTGEPDEGSRPEARTVVSQTKEAA